MKTKNMILTALFLAIGFILHSSVPGIFGMKFDLFLAFMFLSIVIYPTLQNALLAGAVGGMITALTTTFPGGQLPNFIDKMVTALIVYLMIKAMTSLKNDKLKRANRYCYKRNSISRKCTIYSWSSCSIYGVIHFNRATYLTY